MDDQILRWRRPALVAGAVLGPLVTSAVLATVRGSVTTATSVLVLVLWVVAAAALGDRLVGVLAALSGGAWFDFFLTRPYLTFSISARDDVEAAVLLVVISLAVGEIALWGYRQRDHAARRSGYLDGVLTTARTVAEGDASERTLVGLVGQQIVDVLGAGGCRYVEGAVHDARVAVLDHDGTLTRGGGPVDVDRSGLPTDEYVAVEVHRGRRVVGHFLLASPARVSRPNREQRRVAVLLADQVAAATPAAPDTVDERR